MSPAKRSDAAALRALGPTIQKNIKRGLDLSEILGIELRPVIDDGETSTPEVTNGKKEKGKPKGKE